MYIYHYANYCFNVDMEKTIAEIRRNNLQILINESGLGKGKFADKIETAPAYISQIFSEKTKRDMGNELARKVERLLHKPHGWMDVEHYVEETQKITDPFAEAIKKLTDADREALIRLALSITNSQNQPEKNSESATRYEPSYKSIQKPTRKAPIIKIRDTLTDKRPSIVPREPTEESIREQDKFDTMKIQEIVDGERRTGIGDRRTNGGDRRNVIEDVIRALQPKVCTFADILKSSRARHTHHDKKLDSK